MRGALTFVFDDGYTHILENVVPLLDQYRIPGVFAIPLDHTAVAASEGKAVSPWTVWLPLREHDHEIAAHSLNHVDLTTLSDAELDHQLHEPHQTLNATTLIYPGGAHDDRVVKAARAYYKAGRTVTRGFEPLLPHDPMRLKTINWTQRNFSVSRANAFVLWAWLTNTWLIETYHIVDDAPSDAIHRVPLQSFKKHIAFVAKLPIRVDTIENIVQKGVTDKPAPASL